MRNRSLSLGRLPPELFLRVDELCGRFEGEWLAGGRPRLDDFLVTLGAPEYTVLLQELILVDIDYRRQVGEVPSAAYYAERFPVVEAAWLAANIEEVVNVRHAPGSAQTVSHPQPATSVPHVSEVAAAGSQPTVSSYEILGVLGRGGMGVVYKAHDLKLKRTVALKMILAGAQANEGEHARFRAEAEASARLRHPNIVQIYAVDNQEGRPFFSMEFVPGGSLASWLGGQPLPAKQAAHLVLVLARAVHAAHEAGIIHRDLKPANVLLQPEKTDVLDDTTCVLRGEKFTPKITDFGLARLVGQVGAQTQSGDIVGTASYMAPEQAAGRSKSVTPLADVYSLGAILYELLTGRPPFRAATALDTVIQVLSEAPPPLRLFQPDLPRDLETICQKCLQKEPDKRYLSAAALADDLARFLEHDPIKGRPVRLVEEFYLLRKYKPILAWTLLIFAVIWIAGLLIAISAGVRGASTVAGFLAFAATLIWFIRPGLWSLLFGSCAQVGAVCIGLLPGIDRDAIIAGVATGTGIAAWLGATGRIVSKRLGRSLLEWLAGALVCGTGVSILACLIAIYAWWLSRSWVALAPLVFFLPGSFLGGTLLWRLGYDGVTAGGLG